jgi:transposase
VSHAYDLKRLAVDGFDEYGEVVVPDCVRVALRPLVSQIDALDDGAINNEIAMSVKADETAKRLMTVPGVGPVTASAIVATIQDMGDFASGREFTAFLGLTPRQSSTGGKPRLGRRLNGDSCRVPRGLGQGEAGSRTPCARPERWSGRHSAGRRRSLAAPR